MQDAASSLPSGRALNEQVPQIAGSAQSSGAPNVEGSAWVALTDEDRDRAFNTLPDMLEGFMKKWGWLHFAKAIEAECRKKNEAKVESLCALLKQARTHLPIAAASWNEEPEKYGSHVDAVLSLIFQIDAAVGPTPWQVAQQLQARGQLSVNAGTARTDGPLPDGQGEQA